MDERKIQELLELAGGEYNQGKYAEAIAHWQEVLQEDPENQKAREGIRMAKLLVVNWESAQGSGGGDELTLESGGLDPETQEKIDFGIKRIRELMAAGRHKEAMEGSQLLAELAPGSPAVRQLQEEIGHALEAQPFVEEHLGKARKLLAADKAAEALEEARKVLSVDPSNEEARTIVAHGGGAEGPSQAVSAFQREGEAAPPSPFAGSTRAEDLAMNIGLGRDEAPAASGAPQAEEAPLEMGFEEMGEPQAAAPPAASGGSEEVQALVQEGRKLFGQKKYQEAIAAWSRVYAIDESNDEVPALIDQAKAKQAEIAALAEQAMYQGQDQMDAGNLTGARKAFEEVLSIMPGNPEALDQIAKIDAQLGGEAKEDDLGDAIPMEEPMEPAPAPAPARASAHDPVEMPDAPSVGLASDPSDSRDATQPVAPPAPPVSAGLPKRKPVQRVAPPRKGPSMVVMGGLAAVVVVAAAAGWWFVMGPGAEPPAPLDPEPEVAGGPLPGKAPGAGETEAPAKTKAKSGGEGAVKAAGGEAPAEPAATVADPAAVQRRVRALMREGRILLEQEKYAEAKSRFDQVLAMEPANFDAEDMRMKASAGLVEEQRFDRDLESAKRAFSDQDWGSSLYRLYRLQLEREEMKELSRYIKNANYNWGVQSMEAFQVDEAIQHFNDALEQDPGDKDIQQHLEVAERYAHRRRDSAYDAYVAKLGLKPLDGR